MEPENEADGKGDQRPVQQNMFDGSNGLNQADTGQKPMQSPSHVPGTQSIERLRNRIELTVKELTRLRSENASLQKQLQEVKAHPLDSLDGTPVIFTESPAALRAKVEGFIGAIDRYVQATAKEDGASVLNDSGT